MSRCATSSSVVSVVDQRARVCGPGRGRDARSAQGTRSRMPRTPPGRVAGRLMTSSAPADASSTGRRCPRSLRWQECCWRVHPAHRRTGLRPSPRARPEVAQCCCDRLCLVGAASTQIWACDDFESVTELEQIKQRPSERQRASMWRRQADSSRQVQRAPRRCRARLLSVAATSARSARYVAAHAVTVSDCTSSPRRSAKATASGGPM